MKCNKEVFQYMQQEFLKSFNKNWELLMEEVFFQQEQFITGNRLRPYIVLVGYLATKNEMKLESIDYDKISKLSLCIELIHKSSLILDDLIDGDPARHGKKAFHIEYGFENTMMFAINLLSISVKKMNQFILETEDYVILKKKGINLLTQIMYDMSLGELKELNINNENRYVYEKVQEIISLETSPLITNSLLLGYYAGNGDNKDIEQIFEVIGNKCGYIFQIMNDLEPFCHQEKLKLHKGRLNTDIIYAKKNIALTLLYNLISNKEKESLSFIQSVEEQNILLIDYFNKYKIGDSFLREVDLIHQSIQEQICLLERHGLNAQWCVLFQYFIENVVQECKNRLF